MPSNSIKKTVARLHDRRGRRKLGQFLLEGERVVRLGIESDLLIKAIWVDEERPELLELLPDAEAVSRAELGELASTNTPPPVLAVADIPTRSADLDAARGVIVLDGVQDPGNLGSLIRTAQAYDLGGVVLGKGCVDPWSPKVVRGSMGAVIGMPVIEVDSLQEWLTPYAEGGVKIFCADASGGADPGSSESADRWMLVLGSEAHGISREVSQVVSQSITIPISGSVGSLGVAAAGAVLIHLLRSKKRGVD